MVIEVDLDIDTISDESNLVSKSRPCGDRINRERLYFKFTIKNKSYLILLSDITEVKETNQITPIAFSLASENNKIYGVMYYNNEIVPVYKFTQNSNGNNLSLDCTLADKISEKDEFYKVIMLKKDSSYCGMIFNNCDNVEVIDVSNQKLMNLANGELHDDQVIDIKSLLNTI